MSFSELVQARAALYNEINFRLDMVKKEYEPKLAALNLQIDRENKKGIGKRIKMTNTGRFNKTR